MKQKPLHVSIAVLVVIFIAAAVLVRLHSNNKIVSSAAVIKQSTAQQIPTGGVYFSKVRELSQGSKPACLANNQSLDATESSIDGNAPSYALSLSAAIGNMITDMPAGLTTVRLHSYDTTTATGVQIFSGANQVKLAGSLNTFNFAVKRADTNSAWQTTSFIACRI